MDNSVGRTGKKNPPKKARAPLPEAFESRHPRNVKKSRVRSTPLCTRKPRAAGTRRRGGHSACAVTQSYGDRSERGGEKTYKIARGRPREIQNVQLAHGGSRKIQKSRYAFHRFSDTVFRFERRRVRTRDRCCFPLRFPGSVPRHSLHLKRIDARWLN